MEPPDSVRKATQMDSMGFQRQRNELLLMSERAQRTSILSTISEEAPASEAKHFYKRTSN